MVDDSRGGQAGALVEPITQEQVDALPMYEWDVANIGDSAPPFSYTVTEESIADYCQAVRNDNPLFLDSDAAANGPFGGIIAPPTYVFKCAPMRRNELMHAQGYASPEEKRDRATPYAKSAVRFFKPIRPGDEITSVVTLADKYERRGNQFMTLNIQATDGNGDRVAEYDYTIIWRRAPKDPNAAPAPAPKPDEPPEVAKDDQLATVTKTETQDSIDQYDHLTRVRPRISPSLHSDPEFAQRTIFGGTVNMGVATAAYCSEVLERTFGPGALLKPGASLEYKGIRPIHAGSEITLTGRILERGADGISCEIRAVNQDGVLCGIADAVVVPE
jgi:acyl dehydratase